MKNKSKKILIIDDKTVMHMIPMSQCDTVNLIKAHEATGQTMMRDHIEKVKSAVTKAAQVDERFNKLPPNYSGNDMYKPKPYCLDTTTPDSKGQHHAIISTADGRLVRHGYDYNCDEGTCKLIDGESCPTERTTIYARELDRHEKMVRASLELISCRASNGVALTKTKDWKFDEPVKFIYAPAGISTINAGFRKNNTITCCVVVDEDTPKDLQESFDYICATEMQEPMADEDHESKKKTLCFPKDKVTFGYGTIKGHEGVIVEGPTPTTYGADCVNGKVYASWSPEFATDAEYSKATEKKGHFSFADGVRGSASNPARLIAVGRIAGALTNSPAFRKMPPVKAKLAEVEATDTMETDNVTATWSDAARAAAIDALHNHKGTHVIYNDGRDGHKGVKGKILDRDEHGMRVHFEDRARPTHISYKSDEWTKHTKPHHDESTKATDATESATVQAAAQAATDLVAKLEQVKTTSTATANPLADIIARQKQQRDELNVFARRSPEIQAMLAIQNKKPDELIQEISARKKSEREFEADLLRRNPVAANHDALKSIAAKQI